MKIQRITLIASILMLLAAGYKIYKWNNPNYPARFAENSITFQAQERNLNQLVVMVMPEINDDEQHKVLNIDDLAPLTQEKMQELGFQKITIEGVTNPCSSQLVISFEVSEGWNIDELNHVQVIFSPCDQQTRKGYHNFDGGHIDVFGQGNNWKIFSDTDFI